MDDLWERGGVRGDTAEPVVSTEDGWIHDDPEMSHVFPETSAVSGCDIEILATADLHRQDFAKAGCPSTGTPSPGRRTGRSRSPGRVPRHLWVYHSEVMPRETGGL